MNLIKELEPFNTELTNWKNGGAIGQSKIKELSVIYSKLREVKPDVGAKPNLSCSACVNDMLKALYNNRAEQIKKDTVYFKGVPQKEVEEDDGYLHLSWGKLKKYCSDKGINVKGKKRIDLIEELESL